MRTAKQPMFGKPLALVAAVSLIFAMGSARLVEAATLAGATWDTSTTLDFAVGSAAPTVDVGTAITSGSTGRFGEGVDLDSSADRLTYSGASNFNENQGTISFWFRNTYLDLANNGPAKRLLDVQTAGGTRLVDIHWSGSGFDNFTSAAFNGGSTGRGGYPTYVHGNSTEWHYLAYEWDAAAGISKMWMGSQTEGTAINTFGGSPIAPWTPSGPAAAIHVGHWNTGDDPTRGTWDDLLISDSLLYDPSLSSIPLPIMPLAAVPEPAMMGLLGLGGLVGWWWRRRK